MKKKSTPSKLVAKSKNKTTPSSVAFANSPGVNRFIIFGLLAAVLLFVIFVRIRLLQFPMERDEGEYALMGQMLLKGIPPYEMAYNMKLPGAYYLYALMMALFGQTPGGIHFGLLLFNLGSIILLFSIGRRIGNEALGMIAAASYGLLSLLPTHLGFAAHATQFNVAFILGGVLVLLYYEKKRSFLLLILSGILFGYSFLIKQHAIFLLFFGLISLVLLEIRDKPIRFATLIIRILVYGLSMSLPYLLILLMTFMNGTLGQFWHWTVEYSREYVSINTVSNIMSSFKSAFTRITEGVILFWIAGALGWIALFFSSAVRNYRWPIFIFTICSFAAVVPGYYFRKHYFILFLPALSLLIGIAFVFMAELFRRGKSTWLAVIPFTLFAIMFFSVIGKYGKYLFTESPEKLCATIYSRANPFLESAEIAKFLRDNTTEQDKIAVLGSEPQIYFLSQRLPATGYIYTYPFIEAQAYSEPMQKDMITEIEKNKPKFIVMVNSAFSWGNAPSAAKTTWDWYVQYIQQYQTVGIVDIDPAGKSPFITGEALQSYQVKSNSNVWISQLK